MPRSLISWALPQTPALRLRGKTAARRFVATARWAVRVHVPSFRGPQGRDRPLGGPGSRPVVQSGRRRGSTLLKLRNHARAVGKLGLFDPELVQQGQMHVGQRRTGPA